MISGLQPQLISPGCAFLGSGELPQAGSLRLWGSCYSRSLRSLTVESVPACVKFRLIVLQGSLLSDPCLWAMPGVSQGTECKARWRVPGTKPRVTRYTRGEMNLLIEDQVCVAEMLSGCQCQGRKVSHGVLQHTPGHTHDIGTLRYNIRTLSVFEAGSRVACADLNLCCMG